MNAKQSDSPISTLPAVQSFATRVQPEIALYDNESFGRFYFTPNVVINRDNPHFCYETEDGLYVKVDLDYTRKSFQIGSITVLMDGEYWCVDPYNIVCKTNPYHEPDTTYPSWELRWAADVMRPERMGKLEHVSLALEYGKGVFYNYEYGDEQRWVYGLTGAEAQFPESLVGSAQFQDRKLDWNIDSKAKEQEIIARSAIYEFLVSVPTR
jgi:hypothetical protein